MNKDIFIIDSECTNFKLFDLSTVNGFHLKNINIFVLDFSLVFLLTNTKITKSLKLRSRIMG